MASTSDRERTSGAIVRADFPQPLLAGTVQGRGAGLFRAPAATRHEVTA